MATQFTILIPRTIQYFVGTLAALVFTSSAIAQPLVAGRIESFKGLASAYTLERNGKIKAVRVYAPVYQNDKITVKKPHHVLQLTLGGGHRQVKVTDKNSPYTVKDTGKVPNTWDNAWSWITKLLTGYHEDKCDPKQMKCDPYEPVVRSQFYRRMSIPLLGKNPTQMLAGKRRFYLRWYGGKPPYQVTIAHNGQSLTTLPPVKTQWLETKPLSFQAGKNYQVTIQDKNGKSVTKSFGVVAGIKYPDGLQDASFSKKARQTVRATWLASQNYEKKKHKPGLWILEAYQQVSEIADTHYPARILRDRFEKGLRVIEPKEPK